MTKACRLCGLVKPVTEFHKKWDAKDGHHSECKACRKGTGATWQDIRKNYPWVPHFINIKKRCENPKCNSYKYYGGKGVKCLMTSDELKDVWFSDKAYLLKKPSVGRINETDPKKWHYTKTNVRFIELTDNVDSGRKRRHKKCKKYEDEAV